MEFIIILLLALIIDKLIGDPQTRLHPVAIMGLEISLLDKFLYRKEQPHLVKLLSGFMLVCIMILFNLLIINIILTGLNYLPLYQNYLIQAIILSFMISPRSLATAASSIYDKLIVNDIKGARERVNYIVSRDAQQMDEPDIIRASIETVAENTVDGIIAPIFYFVIGGLPLAVIYRVINTMDAMLGYKNEKYLYFGRIAAKVDDLANYIPARITGILMIIIALFFKYDYKNAWTVMRRDAPKHPSPNGGYPEAAVAGALNIRLGGINYYFGHQSFREFMGDNNLPLQNIHIIRTIKIMYGTTLLFAGICIMLLYLFHLFIM